MGSNRTTRARAAAIGAFLVGTIVTIATFAQGPPAGGNGAGAGPAGPPNGPSPAERAIEYRQAVYTVIGGNFGPIGGMLQGRAPFDGADALKRAQRVAFMADFLDDAFPEISKQGETKAKSEIWTERAEFDKLVNDFKSHTAALAATLAKDNKGANDAFKSAATAVANDCKGCHDKFRAR